VQSTSVIFGMGAIGLRMSHGTQAPSLNERIAEWVVYTCLLGLIPVLARFLVWLVTDTGVEPVALSDLVAFGLVLHSANIHEVNRVSGSDGQWKSIHNGISITFIVFYALLMFTTIMPSKSYNQNSILLVTVILCLASVALSIAILYRASTRSGQVS
jgi:hypothetical protein